MFARILLLFVIVPFVELYLLLLIARNTGVLFTIGLVLVTGVVGAWLARREGLKAWRAVQGRLARGKLPSDALVDGLLILIAGAFLVTPGILTDLCGFALLLPVGRRVVKRYLAKRFQMSLIHFSSAPGSPSPDEGPEGDDDVIDVDFRKPRDPT